MTGGSPTRRRGRVFTVALLWALASTSAHAEPWGQLRFKHRTTQDGLSQSIVTSMVQDHVGFLWIGTQGGLNRYDGYRFTQYLHDPAEAEGLPDNWVSCLLEDRRRQLWIGTQTGGVARFDAAAQTFRRVPIRHAQDDDGAIAVFSLLEDQAGRVWMGADRGLYLYHEQDDAFVAVSGVATRNITRLLEAPNQLVLLGTLNGLFIYKPSSGDFWDAAAVLDGGALLRSREILALHITNRQVIWIGTNQGVFRLLPNSNRLLALTDERSDGFNLDKEAVASVWVDHDGMLWLGTERAGLFVWDESSGRFYNNRKKVGLYSSLGSNRVEAILQDRSGLMWFGLMGHGLSYWNPKRRRFNVMTAQPDSEHSLSAPRVIPILEERERDRLWVGTVGGGLNRFDFGTEQWRHYRHDADDERTLSQDEVFALAQDRRGRLWVGTQDRGLCVLDENQDHFTRYRHDPGHETGLGHDKVRVLVEAGQGDMWIGTFGGGVSVFDPDSETFSHYRHDTDDKESLSDDRVISMFCDQQQSMWVGTISGGLNRFDPQRGRFARYQRDPETPEHGPSHNSVIGLIADPQRPEQRLWLATFGGGLNLMDYDGPRPRFRAFGKREGLANLSITGLVADERGLLWFSTQRGLHSFDPVTMKVLKVYTVEDGLPANEFGPWSSFAGASGRLYFGGAYGLIWFEPNALEVTTRQVPMVLTDLRTADPRFRPEVPLDRLNEIRLSHHDSLLALEFAALDFNDPAKHRYRYRVDGLVDEWVELGAERSLNFTNLKAGRYELHVQGGPQGAPSAVGELQLVLHVAPPPWAGSWAYGFYVLLGLGAVLFYQRSQTIKLSKERLLTQKEREVATRLRDLDKLKDEFLANTSHELRTPLNGIVGLTQSLLDGTGGDLNDKQKHDLTMVVASGKRLTALVNDILDFSQLRNRTLKVYLEATAFQQIAERVCALAKPLAKEKKLDLIVDIPADLPPVRADRNRLQQVLVNLLGNAVKYTETGEVRLTARVAMGRLEVAVRDTGIGIPPALQRTIFQSFEQIDGTAKRLRGGAGLGLSITRKLLEMQGGDIEVSSEMGVGSTFRFYLQLADGSVDFDGDQTLDEPLWDTDQKLQQTKSPTQPDIIEDTDDGHAPYRILIVDDEAVNRQVLVNQISLRRFEIEEAGSGPQALRLLQHHSGYDLILLDVMMPHLSGFEVCRRIRREFAADQLPIIFLTARTQVEDAVEGYRAGGNDFLTKPVSKEELLLRIKTHLRLRRRRGAGDASA